MRFKVGDRVISVALPPAVGPQAHKIGTGGTVVQVVKADDESYYRVAFDDGRTWSIESAGLAAEPPPCTVEEAMAGIAEILEVE